MLIIIKNLRYLVIQHDCLVLHVGMVFIIPVGINQTNETGLLWQLRALYFYHILADPWQRRQKW